MVSNAELAEAFFQLAESHPPGELRLALLRAAYAVFDHPRELDGMRRLPETVPLEVLPTVTMLRGCRGRDAVAAAAQRLAGPHRLRGSATREGFLSAAEVARVVADGGGLDARQLRGAAHWHTRASDGAATLEAMARACLRRGATWAVVADHTRGLACVNGLDAEGIEMQRRAVASWNRRHGEELWLLQGLEVEILEDGRLDVPRTAREGVLLVAAIHTGLAERRDQTRPPDARARGTRGVGARPPARAAVRAAERASAQTGRWCSQPRPRLACSSRSTGFRGDRTSTPPSSPSPVTRGAGSCSPPTPTTPAISRSTPRRWRCARRPASPASAIVNFGPLDHLAADRPDLGLP